MPDDPDHDLDDKLRHGSVTYRWYRAHKLAFAAAVVIFLTASFTPLGVRAAATIVSGMLFSASGAFGWYVGQNIIAEIVLSVGDRVAGVQADPHSPVRRTVANVFSGFYVVLGLSWMGMGVNWLVHL